MAALWNSLFGGPVAPATVPTDTILPLYGFDDTFTNRQITFEYTMQFEEVLDADRIAGALWKLIERPGWRRLGSRLRLNNKGKLEYHVPAEYTKERPPINFSKVNHDFPLADHPLSKIIPRSDGTLRSFGPMKPLHDHLELKDNTRYLDDWLYTDKAQLGLHIVTFQDATFITLTWGHTLLDAMGRNTLFKAWIAMLEGRENDVLEFLGYDEDPLHSLGAPISDESIWEKEGQAPVQEDHVLSSQVLTGLRRLRFVFNYMWEIIFHPSEANLMLCMPGSYFAKMRAQALADLATAPADLLTYNTADPTTPFLSDGDILLAWSARLRTASIPSLVASSRTLCVYNVLGLRSVLSRPEAGYKALTPPDKAYLHNCNCGVLTLFPRAQDILTQPLGHVAARIRKDLTLQSTRAQVEAGQRIARGGAMLLFGNSTMAVCAFSNWSKARLFDFDFSSAIVTEAPQQQGEAAQSRKRGRPVHIQPSCTTGKGLVTIRGSGNCVGVDGNGDLWFCVLSRTEYARNLERELERMRVDG